MNFPWDIDLKEDEQCFVYNAFCNQYFEDLSFQDVVQFEDCRVRTKIQLFKPECKHLKVFKQDNDRIVHKV